VRWRRGSIECNTTLRGERFLRPDGSEVSAVNPPVDGSNIPEEEPSPSEDDPEGGAVPAGGTESLVLVAVVVVSVVFVSVEEVSAELVSVEVSAEPVPVELPAELLAVSVEVVVVELSE